MTLLLVGVVAGVPGLTFAAVMVVSALSTPRRTARPARLSAARGGRRARRVWAWAGRRALTDPARPASSNFTRPTAPIPLPHKATGPN
jgi:hypothetical protein